MNRQATYTNLRKQKDDRCRLVGSPLSPSRPDCCRLSGSGDKPSTESIWSLGGNLTRCLKCVPDLPGSVPRGAHHAHPTMIVAGPTRQDHESPSLSTLAGLTAFRSEVVELEGVLVCFQDRQVCLHPVQSIHVFRIFDFRGQVVYEHLTATQLGFARHHVGAK